MKNYEFSPLNMGMLRVNGVYSFGKSTYDLSNPVVDQIGAIPAAGLTQVHTTNVQLGAALNKPTKSALTGELKQLDTERDSLLIEIRREVSVGVKSSVDAKKAAGSVLQLYLSPYHKVEDIPLDIETGVINELLIKFNASDELKAAAVTLAIDGLFTLLGAKNTLFDQKYKSRNTEYSKKGDTASDVRAAAVAALSMYYGVLEQTVNLTPNDTLLALFNQLDELRKKYHALEGSDGDKPAETAK
jgi:hypothetical protein